MQTKEVICGICPEQCHVKVEINEGKITKVAPSKVNDPSGLCMRGTCPDEIINSPDRVKYPLKRVGKKGSYKFKKISWETAITEIAEKFKEIITKYGAPALASHFGTGCFDQATTDYISMSLPQDGIPGFFEPIGSPNNGTISSLCYVSFGAFAPISTFGFPGNWFVSDLENTNLVVIWGTNPKPNSPPQKYKQVMAAKRRGAKIVVIDHYKSSIAEMADKYIEIKSGTDGAMILGMINYMFQNNMIDKEFLKSYTHGYEKLETYVREFNLEKVERITGVSKEVIIWLTTELCKNVGTALMTYTGLEYSGQGVQTIRSLFILWALSDNLDVKGGYLINSIHEVPRVKRSKVNPIYSRRIGEKEFPLYEKILKSPQYTKLPQAVLKSDPYPVKAILNCGSNMSQSYPNSPLYEKMLLDLDFYVVIDRFITKDALYADIVLPATTYYEDQSYVMYPDKVEIRNRVVDPVGESKSNIFILQMIAEALGYGENYPKTEEELLDYAFFYEPHIAKALKEDGIYYFEEIRKEEKYKKWESGELRIDGKPGFPTSTGKIEIYSTLLESYGYDPLPVYRIDEADKSYPLIMNTGARINSSYRSQHLNIPSLVKYQPEAQFLIHPDDAASRGIQDGDRCSVFNDKGTIEMYANVTDKAQIGDIEVNFGGGSPLQAEKWRKASVNHLTDERQLDPISGFPVYKRLFCEVERA